MDTKDLVLLMLIPAILISLIVYTDTSSVITGAVTQEQKKESNIIGTYSINPSFKVKENYDLKDYSKIKESLDFIIKCAEEGKDIEKTCIKKINEKDTSLKWELNCDKGAEKILYDFAEFLQDCFDSEDSNCLCSKNMKLQEEELKKYDLSNKQYQIILEQDIDLKKINIKMKEPNIDISYDIKISSKSKSTWYPNTIVLAYILNKVELIFKNVEGETLMEREEYYYPLPPDKKEIIVYKSKANNLDYVDFVKQENDNLKYPNNQIITDSNNKPIDIKDIHPCQIKPKNIYKFCVTQNNYKLMAYDKLDGQVKERHVTIKFASYISTPPPKIQEFEIYDRPKAEKSMIVKWRRSSSDIEKYKIYFTETPNILEKNPTSDLNKDSRVIIKEIKPNEAILTNVGASIKFDNCDFEYSTRKCQFSDREGHKISIEKDKFYYNKDNGLYIYHLSVPKEAQDYDFAITAMGNNGKELSNIGENQKIAVILSKKSIDDLPPDKIQTLEGTGTPDGKVKLKWKMPIINIDGSSSNDLVKFNIYQKKFIPTPIPEFFDNSYNKKTKYVSEICDIKLNCEYVIGNLEAGQFYNFAVTAIDQNSNEFTEELNIIKVPVPIS